MEKAFLKIKIISQMITLRDKQVVKKRRHTIFLALIHSGSYSYDNSIFMISMVSLSVDDFYINTINWVWKRIVSVNRGGEVLLHRKRIELMWQLFRIIKLLSWFLVVVVLIISKWLSTKTKNEIFLLTSFVR